MKITQGRRGYTVNRHHPGLRFMLTIGLLSVALFCQAKEMQRLEALGVVNGSITAARNTQVDITVFLSGQPLFSATDLTESTPVNMLWVEQATLVSQDSSTVRVQQPFPLTQGGTGHLQMSLQVRINGKAIKVKAQETALGVQLMLPDSDETARVVEVYPEGAALITVPGAYRGDLQMQLRMTAE